MKKLIYILILMLLAGCTKDLDLEYHDIDPLPVIEATLTDKGLDVRMTLTSPMDEPMDTTPLTDYSVSLSDSPENPIVGRNYRLEIMRDGKSYVSECIMQPQAEIEDVSFQWIKMPYDSVSVMQILLRDNPDIAGEAWWVRVWRNGKIFKWLLNDDKFAVDGLVELTTMAGRKNPDPDDEDDNLAPGDTLLVTATAIPRHIYTYVSRLSAHTIAGPTTFTGAPALGYFLAATPADTTLIY